MNTEATNPPPPQRVPAAGARRVASRVGRVLLALLILAVGGGIAAYFLLTRPQARRRRPGAEAVLVTVEPVRRASYPAIVQAMGTVQPARVVSLSPRVGGEVTEVSPELLPGGLFEQDDEIVWIDPKDYQIAVRQQTAALAQAKAQLDQRRNEVNQRKAESKAAVAARELERGQQAVALQEYKLLGESVAAEDRDLVLRKPQWAAAEAECQAREAAEKAAEAIRDATEATVRAAEAVLEKAELDEKRTVVRAPFNAIVLAKSVEKGAQVSAASELGKLAGTDEYWVQVAVPVDELRWLQIPRRNGESGSAARVYDPSAWGKGVFREGRILRLEPQLESQGRMARLIISVTNPLGLTERGNQKRPQTAPAQTQPADPPASGTTSRPAAAPASAPASRPATAPAPAPAMILGAFVRVELIGRPMQDVARVPRDVLLDGDRAKLMTDAGKLEIRKVQVLRRDRQYAYVADSLRPGERLVTSDIGAPVAGMALRVPEQRPVGDGPPQDRPPPATEGADTKEDRP
jgi:multidrug efflux pump subunit AcrA (membrane-fusion protein)